MSTTETVESLLVEEHEKGVVVLTINRPSARNAVDLITAQAISRTLDALDDDPDCRVIVLTGAQGFFSAGMDLKAFRATGERPIDAKRGPFGLVHMPPETPIIAAVEGAAVGGGFEIALSCDLVVAAEDAVFGLPEVKRGLTAAGGGLLRLPSRIPYHLAMEAALTGRALSALWCSEAGLINRVVESGQALGAALALAQEIGANGPLAVKASKKVIVESANWTAAEVFDRQETIVDPVRRSSDAQEGAAAFAEKRAPNWTGR
ncbi:crotonase/enoyl-CoA hydratase family protein [Rhodococcus sp. B50]|uniref:crotonase/enoyl-CoA hydratase family protein n=1 Tax=Rhodococcus sp. B50 TaxID=2682847 RepID=UPI001BD66AC0|nr:crotonase/enoyl-CoA hydratase family protein [Rhodococcus sp. B50]MBS9376526.1 Carnitinyl-CoA dehydratase [Rhodococcus sp. B50]